LASLVACMGGRILHIVLRLENFNEAQILRNPRLRWEDIE